MNPHRYVFAQLCLYILREVLLDEELDGLAVVVLEYLDERMRTNGIASSSSLCTMDIAPNS
jgi:hypothetical protein